MKNVILIILFLGSIATFGQQKTNTPTEKDTLVEKKITSIKEIPGYNFIKRKINLTGVVVSADKAPEFPGGYSKFLKEFSYNMPYFSKNEYDAGETRVYFIVDKDGFVRTVLAIGKNKKITEAAELSVKRIFKRWQPAIKEDEKVRFLHTFVLNPKK